MKMAADKAVSNEYCKMYTEETLNDLLFNVRVFLIIVELICKLLLSVCGNGKRVIFKSFCFKCFLSWKINQHIK